MVTSPGRSRIGWLFFKARAKRRYLKLIRVERVRRPPENLTSLGAPEIFGQSPLIIIIQIQKKLDSSAISFAIHPKRYSFKIRNKTPYATHHLVHYFGLHCRPYCQVHHAHSLGFSLDNTVRYRRINHRRTYSPTVFETCRRLSLSPSRIDSLHYWRAYRSFYRWQNHLIIQCRF